MNKIPTLFVRDPANMSRVTREVTPGCEWVLAGEGIPTRKRDGANVRVVLSNFHGQVLAQYDKRRNVTRKERAEGKEPGYVPVNSDDPGDKWLMEALRGTDMSAWPLGSHPCEALGEKIQGGVEGTAYRLYPFLLRPETLYPEDNGHGLLEKPWTYDSIEAFLRGNGRPMEGIVWHHPDGRMAKIKSRDFGIKWPR